MEDVIYGHTRTRAHAHVRMHARTHTHINLGPETDRLQYVYV